MKKTVLTLTAAAIAAGVTLTAAPAQAAPIVHRHARCTIQKPVGCPKVELLPPLTGPAERLRAIPGERLRATPAERLR